MDSAGGREGCLRRAERLSGRAQCGFRTREFVGRGVASGFGVGQGAEQALAALFQGGDHFVEGNNVGLGFLKTFLKRGDVIGGALAARFPAGAFGSDRIAAALAGLTLADVGGDAGLRDGEGGALLLRGALDFLQSRSWIGFAVKLRQFVLDVVEGSLGIGLRGFGAVPCLGNRGHLRFGGASLPFDRFEGVARGDVIGLRVAPKGAEAFFFRGCCGVRGGGLLLFGGQALCFRLGELFALEHVGEAVAFGEALGGRRHAAGDGDEPVPTPEVALAADEALALLQMRLQTCAELARDDADLAQATREFGRCADVEAERLGVGGQGFIVGPDFDAAPTDVGAFVDRRIEIVAEGRNKGCFVAGRDAQRLDDGRHAIFVGRHHELRERFAFGDQRGERHACALGGFALGAREFRKIAELVFGVERGGLDFRDFARETLALLGDGGELQRIGCGSGGRFSIALESGEFGGEL